MGSPVVILARKEAPYKEVAYQWLWTIDTLMTPVTPTVGALTAGAFMGQWVPRASPCWQIPEGKSQRQAMHLGSEKPQRCGDARSAFLSGMDITMRDGHRGACGRGAPMRRLLAMAMAMAVAPAAAAAAADALHVV